MDPDIPHPSIETNYNDQAHNDDRPTGPSQASGDRSSLSVASATPLPPSSPVRSSPRKSPNIQRHATSTQSPATFPSPARRVSGASPLNPDRRSSTPQLQHQRSISSPRNFPPTTPIRRTSTAMSLSRSSTVMPEEGAVPSSPPLTASTIAKTYFEKELEPHRAPLPTKTVVIVHDYCYGHRFSRPRTTKAVLGTIVERPERILATVLGLTTAYVRLGGRHEGGRHAPKHEVQPTAAPPFRICKTSRTVPLESAAPTFIHGQKWMEELKAMCDTAEMKLAANGKELVRPEGTALDQDGTPRPKLHEGDLYLCSESLNALEGCLGGVCEGIDSVFTSDETRRAFVCIRPPGHHCSADFPSGFCWLNNVHVGIAHAAMTHGLTHAAIIDFDLHHGDGSQAITWDHNVRAASLPKTAAPYKKTPIGYYSLHDINSYPCELGDEEKVRNASLCIENAHGQSIWNVHLEPWRTHQDFWNLYESRYSVLLQKVRVFLRHHTSRLSSVTNGPKPKAAVFISAGFDASEWEGAGMQRHKVNVPTDFYARFTADIVKMSEEEGLGVDGRVISVLEGGYSDRALTSGVLSHVCGLSSGTSPTTIIEPVNSLENQMQGLQVSNGNADGANLGPERLSFDIEWWSPHHLEALEALVTGPQTPPLPKKTKEIVAGNYSSPTHASLARSTSGTEIDRRSFSGEIGPARRVDLKPEAPPPGVDWVTASVELSRLLVPQDRTTVSCRHDQLNAEATRVRKARQSTIGIITEDANVSSGDGEKKMQLRERKSRAPVSEVPVVKAASRANRRRTISAVQELPDPTQVDGPHEDAIKNDTVLPARHNRRTSDASSIISGFGNMRINEEASPSSNSRQTSRASSMMPEVAQAAPKPLAPKKARPMPAGPPKAKPPPSITARNSPKRDTVAPPAAAVAPSLSQSSNGTAHTRRPSQPPIMTTTNAIVGAASDVDKLATGVKKMKIKLKVPPPEENAAREKKAMEEKASMAAPKEKKPRAPRKAAIPKVAKTAIPGTSEFWGTAQNPKATSTAQQPPEQIIEAQNARKSPRVRVALPTAFPASYTPAPAASSTYAPPAYESMAYVNSAHPPGYIPPSYGTPAWSPSTYVPPSYVPGAQPPVPDFLPPSGAIMPTMDTDYNAQSPRTSPPVNDDLGRNFEIQYPPTVVPPVFDEKSVPADPLMNSNAHSLNPPPVPVSPPTSSYASTSAHTGPTETVPPAPSNPTSPTVSSTPPTVKRTRADMPVFTSNSPIPFAKPKVEHSADNLPAESSSNGSPTTDNTLPFSTTAQSNGNNGQGPSQAVASNGIVPVKEESRPQATDIWDVPATPHPPRQG